MTAIAVAWVRCVDLCGDCGNIMIVRWLIALALSFAVASPAEAGVFKSRGKDTSKPAPAPAPAKKPAVAKKTPAPAKEAAPKKVAAKKTPAKKGRSSAVASNGRPDDLTPDAPTKKSKDGDVVITEGGKDEDDVIIRDIDD